MVDRLESGSGEPEIDLRLESVSGERAGKPSTDAASTAPCEQHRPLELSSDGNAPLPDTTGTPRDAPVTQTGAPVTPVLLLDLPDDQLIRVLASGTTRSSESLGRARTRGVNAAEQITKGHVLAEAGACCQAFALVALFAQAAAKIVAGRYGWRLLEPRYELVAAPRGLAGELVSIVAVLATLALVLSWWVETPQEAEPEPEPGSALAMTLLAVCVCWVVPM